MTTALTPPLALAYLDELSLGVRAAVVLGADGEPLAGDAALAPRARALLAGTPGVRTARAHDETLVVAEGRDGGAIAALAGPRALVSLLGHDLEQIAHALAGAS